MYEHTLAMVMFTEPFPPINKGTRVKLSEEYYYLQQDTVIDLLKQNYVLYMPLSM
jgi:hypothetical protein